MIENEVATLWWRLFFLCEAVRLCGRYFVGWRLFYIDGFVYAMEVFVSFKVRDCFLLAHKISRRHIYEQNSE